MARQYVFTLDLTPNEERIADLVAQGAQNPAISRRLRMTPAATKTAIHRIYDKLGCSDRQELAFWWFEGQYAAQAEIIEELKAENATLRQQLDQWKMWKYL